MTKQLILQTQPLGLLLLEGFTKYLNQIRLMKAGSPYDVHCLYSAYTLPIQYPCDECYTTL